MPEGTYIFRYKRISNNTLRNKIEVDICKIFEEFVKKNFFFKLFLNVRLKSLKNNAIRRKSSSRRTRNFVHVIDDGNKNRHAERNWLVHIVGFALIFWRRERVFQRHIGVSSNVFLTERVGENNNGKNTLIMSVKIGITWKNRLCLSHSHTRTVKLKKTVQVLSVYKLHRK